MIASERTSFGEYLAQTFAVYNQPITPQMLNVWWAALNPFLLPAVQSALTHHVADYNGYGYRAPTPADILRHLEVTLPTLVRERCAQVLQRAQDDERLVLEEIRRMETDVELKLVTAGDIATRVASLKASILTIRTRPDVRAAKQSIVFRDARTRAAPLKHLSEYLPCPK